MVRIMPRTFDRASFQIAKRDQIRAIGSCLLIPFVILAGGKIFSAINPEIAQHTNHYVLFYWLLEKVRSACLMAAFLVGIGLWFLSCYFLLRAKKQSPGWLWLGMLGPYGLIVLTTLTDRAEQPWDFYGRFVRRLHLLWRVLYELCLAYAVWSVAYEIMVLKRNLMIHYEAARTGVSTAQIVNQQNASGGMWAFSEGLEVMFLVVLLYLFLPICINFAGYLYRALPSLRRASMTGPLR